MGFFLDLVHRADRGALPDAQHVGLAWLQSGLGKLADPGWAQGGASLRAYWERAATIPEAPARPSITCEWYRDFLNMLIDQTPSPGSRGC